jgi:tetratricopeptide (TPR) repeat protein
MRRLLTLALLALVCSPFAFGGAAVDEAQGLIGQGKLEQALKVLDHHLQSAPQDAEARFSRGLVLVRLNRTDDAQKAFTELTRDYPQLPEPYNNLAVLYAQQGEYEKARDALEAALATHPSYAMAHENLGDIYAALAVAAYNRAQTLDPNNPGVKAKLSLISQLDSLADSGAAVTARPAKATAAVAAEAPAASGEADALTKVVQDWAAAWSAKDTDKYLALYGSDFAPEGGLSRQAWESQRRARIGKPKQIKVQVSNLQVAKLGDDRAKVSFVQDYQSDSLSNHVGKVLEMKRADGGWRIVREYSR